MKKQEYSSIYNSPWRQIVQLHKRVLIFQSEDPTMSVECEGQSGHWWEHNYFSVAGNWTPNTGLPTHSPSFDTHSASLRNTGTSIVLKQLMIRFRFICNSDTNSLRWSTGGCTKLLWHTLLSQSSSDYITNVFKLWTAIRIRLSWILSGDPGMMVNIDQWRF
jgi:hypothetical protein